MINDLPEGYRLMDVGEKPNKNDLVYSSNNFKKYGKETWNKTTMNNKYTIETVPSYYGLYWATKKGKKDA